MKIILFIAILICLAFSQTCDSAKLNSCLADSQKAFQFCDKAAKQKGQDQQADIQCMKYFLVMRKDCWPCVCQIAKQQGWKIKGCTTTFKNLISLDKNLRQK